MRLLLIAIQFLTRLPMPPRLNDDLATTEAELGKATRYFPLVGVIVGGACAALFWLLSSFLFPPSLSALLALGAGWWLTNGFHEDGWADAFDGFGGGWTRERILEIMHDSRLGTYGTLALLFLISCKYVCLVELPITQSWRWLIIANVTGRWTVLPLCAWLPYARAEGLSRLVAQQVGRIEFGIGTLTLMAVLCGLQSWRVAVCGLALTMLATWFAGRYFRARLGGITGDCLGAANQLVELVLYLCAVALWRGGWL
jgi:adenosylcobinamide-GDP ribazoletransferase